MKITFEILFLLILSSCAKAQESKQYFNVCAIYNNELELASISNVYGSKICGENLFIWGSNDSTYLTDAIFVVEEGSGKILFSYEFEKSPYGGDLYEVSVDNNDFVLLEVNGEYYSQLSLFRVSKNTFSYVGDFEVISKPENYSEDLSYPVKKIEVVKNGSKVKFIFKSKSALLTYDDRSNKIFSNLTYEYDLLKDKLSVIDME
ncbi:MAG: hypothetical protein HRT61_07625 [Ekhidna sp.]|nr:hypothetical protein [Ekhidna sp.]